MASTLSSETTTTTTTAANSTLESCSSSSKPEKRVRRKTRKAAAYQLRSKRKSRSWVRRLCSAELAVSPREVKDVQVKTEEEDDYAMEPRALTPPPSPEMPDEDIKWGDEDLMNTIASNDSKQTQETTTAVATEDSDDDFVDDPPINLTRHRIYTFGEGFVKGGHALVQFAGAVTFS